MKISSLSIALVFIVGIAISCSTNQEAVDSVTSETVDATPQAQLATMPSDLYSDGITKLIKTAHYRFEVANVQKSINAIEISVRKYQAYISASDMRLDNPILENKITIRVPNDYFHDLLKEIDLQARYVNFRDIKTEDVSKQFVDLESRLKTKREVELRYIEILRKKAGTIEELLNAEKQIGELQEEIEATISRINFLKDEVRYSTIHLEFYQTISREIAAADKPSAIREMKEALVAGWSGLIIVITGILYLWPLLVVGFIVVLIYRVVRRKEGALKI